MKTMEKKVNRKFVKECVVSGVNTVVCVEANIAGRSVLMKCVSPCTLPHVEFRWVVNYEIQSSLRHQLVISHHTKSDLQKPRIN
jgi:hypothetical protein